MPAIDFPRLSLTLLFAFAACSSGGDPDREIEGGGVIEKGWEVRFDKPESKLANLKFVKNAAGFLAENGPNAILWQPATTAENRYALSVRVHHIDSHGHPHGAGLIFGGSKLKDDTQGYTYFLVRGDGRYLIKKRVGKETEHVTPWMPHDAIKKESDPGGAKNQLRVEVGEKTTRFLVNGVEVHDAPKGTIPTDGHYGLRIVHNLKIQFADLALEPKT